jgi:hypothetical protein
MAVWLTCSWLVLRDTNALDAKKPIARTYIASVLPRLRASGEVVLAASPVPLEAAAELL